MMKLFARRKRLEDMAKAEDKGRSFWTEKLDRPARTKLFHLVNNLFYDNKSLLYLARRNTLQDLGIFWLSGTPIRGILDAELEDVNRSILQADEDVVFSLLEAIMSLPSMVDYPLYHFEPYLKKFVKDVRMILREHRVTFDIIEGCFVPFESRVMHESVVIPTLTLLGNNKDFTNVETAYQKALDELHRGSPENSITDASTALQETLTVLECQGNRLGTLCKSAVKKGIISSHDIKLIDWVSADRSTMGDAHNVTSASTEDAWLAVHVVGAIILRITNGPMRSGRRGE